jgi:hypothetical protein
MAGYGYTVSTDTNTIVTIDGNGHKTVKQTIEQKQKQKSTEPDFIKLYTNMWCVFNNVPPVYEKLFLALAKRMSYCDAEDLEGSQIVFTGQPNANAICKECGWENQRTYKKGLAELTKLGVIRHVSRGVYQINPTFAGKGLWQYNPKLKQGGIEKLVATFNLSSEGKTVETEIKWQETKDVYEDNQDYYGDFNPDAPEGETVELQSYVEEITMEEDVDVN